MPIRRFRRVAQRSGERLCGHEASHLSIVREFRPTLATDELGRHGKQNEIKR
jgi:hypothetical protein